MDRVTRKELKQDRFAQEVGHTFEFLNEHKKQMIWYGAAAAAVVAIAFSVFYFNRHQRAGRQQQLRAAMEMMEAPVGSSSSPGAVSFNSAAEKEAAVSKAFTDLAAKATGSDEGAVAQYFLGSAAVGEGKLDEATRLLESAAKTGGKEYASLANLTLAQVYSLRGKNAEAEKLLRALISQPTAMVSQAQATLVLARLIGPTQPDEARKLLEPLRTAPGAVGTAALTALGDLTLKKQPQGT